MLAKQGSAWIGWSGVAGSTSAAVPSRLAELTLSAIDLTAEEHGRYYQGFCNATLWPLLHGDLMPSGFDRRAFRTYEEVNRRFAARAARLAAPGATVWVHDFHLMLVPRLLRTLRPDVKIGFFLHVPVQTPACLGATPWRRALVEGMLGADLLGFQTARDLAAFGQAAQHFGTFDGADGRLRIHHRTGVTECGVYPASVDFAAIRQAATAPEMQARALEIRESLGIDRTIILGVDRLDYVKGIPERLEAFTTLLRQGIIAPDEAVFVQVAAPSREGSLGYEQARIDVERAVSQALASCPDLAVAPVRYVSRSLSFEELVPLYLAADVMCLTPLADGMNLVAKEYVACRKDSGALVLSINAGASDELTDAWLVDPEEPGDVMRGLLEALRCPQDERERRMSRMSEHLGIHDDKHWANSFLDDLEAVVSHKEGASHAG